MYIDVVSGGNLLVYREHQHLGKVIELRDVILRTASTSPLNFRFL